MRKEPELSLRCASNTPNPPLLTPIQHHAGKPVDQMVREIQEEWTGVIIACGKPWSLLGQDNQRTIYPTHPKVQSGATHNVSRHSGMNAPPTAVGIYAAPTS